MLVEANNFLVAVSIIEYEESREHSKWAHRYITVAIELARVVEQQFGQQGDLGDLPWALCVATMTLVAKVKE